MGDTSNGGMNIHNGVFTVPLGQGGVYQMSLSVKTWVKGAGSIVSWIRLNNGKIKDLGGVQRFKHQDKNNEGENVVMTTMVYYTLRAGDRVIPDVMATRAKKISFTVIIIVIISPYRNYKPCKQHL